MADTDDSDARVKTGVKGFDELVGGGIPKGNVVLVSGAAGTGKSMFCTQFIYSGALEYGEPGVYVTLEEFPDRFIANAKKLGFTEIDRLIDEKRMAVVKMEVFDIDKLVSSMEDLIDEYSAKRVVLDSVSALSAFAEKTYMVRKSIFETANMLKKAKVTSLFTCGISAMTEGHFGVSVEEYVVDGVVTMFHPIVGTEFSRAIGVVKMRGTVHSESLHPVMLSDKGIAILKSKNFPSNFSVA